MYFDLVSRLIGLPTGLLASLCMVESNHKNVLNPNDGGTASYGYCQIKLNTARSVDPAVTKSDLMTPDKNIWLSGLHLKTLYNKQKSIVRALCQYNTGKPHNSCPYARKVISEWIKTWPSSSVAHLSQKDIRLFAPQ